MKRLAAFLLFSLLLITPSCLLPRQGALAADKYITSQGTTMDIVLDENGDAAVSETWNYYFGGDTITRYSRSYKENDYEMTDFSVCFDGEPMTLLDSPDDSRPVGCSAVYSDENGMHVDVYMSALDEPHTIKISYLVKNAVILHDDIAEFRWNLTSDSEAVSISSLSAHVEIPYGTVENGLYIWAHGPSNGSFDKLVENGMVNTFSLEVQDIPSDTPVNIRMAMPLQLFPNGQRHESGDALQSILDYENNYGTSTENKLLSVPVAAIFLSFLSFFFGPALYSLIEKRVYIPIKLKKYRKKPASSPDYYRSLPDELPPAMVRKLTDVYAGYIRKKGKGKKSAHSDGIFESTLLDLSERGVIKISVDGDSGKTIFTPLKSGVKSLNDYEASLLDLFTTACKEKDSIDMDSLNNFLTVSRNWSQKKRSEFSDCVNSSFELFNFTEVHTVRKMKKSAFWITLAVLSLLGAGIGAALNIADERMTSAIIGFIAVFLTTAALTLAKKCIFVDVTTLTQDGENRLALWNAFARFLDDFTTFDERKLPDISVWRKYLVYAAALGRSEKVTAALKVKYPLAYESTLSNDIYEYESVISIANTLESSGYSIHSYGSDEDSGSGGSFSSSDGGSDSGSSGSSFD